MEPAERSNLLSHAPESASLIKRYAGAADFINDIERYCLWVEPQHASIAMSIPALGPRWSRVSEFRSGRNDKSTQDFAAKPWQFKQPAYKPTDSILVPSTSSARREYIPMGFIGPDTVVSNLAYAVYDAKPWVFAILTSSQHVAWARAVGGQMKTDYRYSNTIVYNNFPVPPLSDAMKEKLTATALRVLDVREYHCEQTLAELYDPEKMPVDLRQAHAEVDALVDSIYSKRGYETDEQRLSDLFAMYEEMTNAETARASVKKTRRTAK